MARIPLGIEVTFLKTPEVAKLREKRLALEDMSSRWNISLFNIYIEAVHSCTCKNVAWLHDVAILAQALQKLLSFLQQTGGERWTGVTPSRALPEIRASWASPRGRESPPRVGSGRLPFLVRGASRGAHLRAERERIAGGRGMYKEAEAAARAVGEGGSQGVGQSEGSHPVGTETTPETPGREERTQSHGRHPGNDLVPVAGQQ